MKVLEKVIVVIGGGNGIGRQLVIQLLQKGAKVVAVDMNEEALKETLQLADHHPNLTYQVVNITSKEAVNQLAANVISTLGHVDGYINVAGIIQPFIPVNELDDVVVEKVMNVNFYGTYHMVRSFLPHLLTRKEAHIVHISSMGGFVPVPGQTIYGASKAAVKLLTEGLHSECKGSPVHVSVVFPGGVATDITKNSNVKLTSKMENMQQTSSIKLLTPAQCAQIIIKGMEKNRYHIVAGQDAKFMYFLNRIAPKAAANIIAKMLNKVL
jgi:short-subunit dehydrogenase